MIKKTGSFSLIILMILCGLFLMSNIYVLGNRQAAIEMHEDLAATVSTFMVNLKVLVCFFTGLLYVIAGIALIRKQYKYCLAGLIGTGLFITLYIIEIILWIKIHPRLLFYFSIAGSISLLFGFFCWKYWYERRI